MFVSLFSLKMCNLSNFFYYKKAGVNCIRASSFSGPFSWRRPSVAENTRSAEITPTYGPLYGLIINSLQLLSFKPEFYHKIRYDVRYHWHQLAPLVLCVCFTVQLQLYYRFVCSMHRQHFHSSVVENVEKRMFTSASGN